MTIEIVIVFTLIVVVVLAFFREWGTPDSVALYAAGSILLSYLVLKLINGATSMPDMEVVLQAFQNPAPITIAAMFILSAGLERTGCIDTMGKFFRKAAGNTELRVMFVMMFMAAILSAFVNNTPIVVVFLPIVMSLSKSTNLKASRLLIPLSFASILGGTCTLTGTSTNLIIAGVASDNGQPAFTMFELTKLGIIYAVIGFVYMLTIGRKLLPKRDSLDQHIEPMEKRHFLTQVEVLEGSKLIGKTVLEALVKRFPEIGVLEIQRKGTVQRTALDKLLIEERDRILLTIHGASFEEFKNRPGLSIGPDSGLKLQEMETRPMKLMEGIIGPDSKLVGRTIKRLRFRQNYGAQILAVYRRGAELKKNFEDVRLRFGDTVLFEGPAEAINRLMRGTDFITLNEPPKDDLVRGKAWIAALIALLFILGASFKLMPIVGLALLAAIAMVATGCLPMQTAYNAVQWNIIFLIIGMLIVGKAMEQTGAAKLITDGVMQVFGGYSPVIVLAVIYILSSTLTELISNAAVAALLTPIVIGIAGVLEVDPRPFIVAIMFGCSASFATPIGYQTNTYVYGAGGYKFSDFPKVGVPLNLMLWVVATLLIPVFWKFHP